MGPLKSLKIAEFAGIGPGPMAAMALADLGATVLRLDRVEPSGLGIGKPPRFDILLRGRKRVAWLSILRRQRAQLWRLS